MLINPKPNGWWCLLLIGLAAIFVTVTGCAPTGRATDPLAGWNLATDRQPAQSIEDDYKRYQNALPELERKTSRVDAYLQNGIGRHAVVIEVAPNGARWCYLLVYDQANKRVRVVKYSAGSYRS